MASHLDSFHNHIVRLNNFLKMKGTKVLTLRTVGVYTSPVFSHFHGLPTSVYK